MSKPVLLFDIGGTKIRAGISQTGRTIDSVQLSKTPANFSDGVQECVRLAKALLHGQEPRLCVVGIAGVLSLKKTGVLRSRNLRGWEGKPLGPSLTKALRCPVIIENDANLGGLGEAMFGAARGRPVVAFLTVGTGFGGARIVEGCLDRSALGFEPGKQIVSHQGRGKPKTIEGLVSGAAVTKRFRKLPREIRDAGTWRSLSDLFSLGVLNAIVFWSPDVVVLGGSMLNQPGLSIQVVRRNVQQWLRVYPKHPAIVRGQLGDTAGLYGGLALASMQKNKR